MGTATQVLSPDGVAQLTHRGQRQLLNDIIQAYDSVLVRSYSKVRFTIMNINILHILALCLRDKVRVLDVGCGFGLFGCYFSSIFPNIEYIGYDINPKRIDLANQTAEKLGRPNAHFYCRDARDLQLGDNFDAVLMIDLLHHIDDRSKRRLLDTCIDHLSPNGRLIIKDVTRHPPFKLFFTWVLDVLMTRSFDMWYWDEEKFIELLNISFERVNLFPITDWLPYPHIVYLFDNRRPA